MKDRITPFGKRWEYRHSIWFVWLLFPFGITSFISFFYIGARVKRLKWMISAIIYLIITILFFVVSEYFPIDHIIYDIDLGITIAAWIAAWVQAATGRRLYLQLLAKKIARESEEFSIQLEPGSRPVPISSIESIPKTIGQIQSVTTESLAKDQVVDMNNAKKEEIALIPGIGTILAEEIIQMRNQIGSFHSLSHFIKVMDIKPHLLAKAKPHMRFSHHDVAPITPTKTEKEKIESEYSAGRIVDF